MLPRGRSERPGGPRRGAARSGVLPACLLCLAACDGVRADEDAAPPLVLWVVIDTLRADELGAYGAAHGVTPALDALAAEAVVFEQAFANAPWTKPSVATMFTSLHTSQHLVFQESTQNQLADSFTTVAEVFADAGYATAGLSQNPHVHAALGFAQGFDTFEVGELWQASPLELGRTAIAWLDSREEERPWFLYVHFLDPHDPYRPGDDDLAEDSEPDGRSVAELVAEGRANLLLDDGVLRRPLTDEQAERLRGLYRRELGRVDTAVGELLDRVRGEAPVVVLTSDHGEEFLEHGTLLHGYQLYDESLHVPLIVSAPGFGPGTVPILVSHVDVAPTVLELAGLPVPTSYMGRSLVPAMRAEPIAPRPVLASTIWKGLHRVAVRTERWKRIEDQSTGVVELYDLAADAGEQHDVSELRLEVCAELARLAEELLAPLPGFAPEEAFGVPHAETEDRLRELGYAGD